MCVRQRSPPAAAGGHHGAACARNGGGLQPCGCAASPPHASLARRPDLAAALWERLVAAVVVSPASTDNPAVPRYDLSYQLNEIEVR